MKGCGKYIEQLACYLKGVTFQDGLHQSNNRSPIKYFPLAVPILLKYLRVPICPVVIERGDCKSKWVTTV
jgi:hypothetical protein